MRRLSGTFINAAAAARAAAAAVLLLSACGDARPLPDEGATLPRQDLNTAEVTQTYSPELGVDLAQMTRTGSGLYIQDIEEGQGAVAEPGNTVVVHYTGWLANGEQFDSSRPRGEPFQVVIGAGEVIDGWDQGIPGMRAGGTRRLVIPPALGYGAMGAGMGIIPPGATLIFDVELLEVRP
jgi:FKBP-type peptidyl-prolyl cis-trans isomerase FkpA